MNEVARERTVLPQRMNLSSALIVDDHPLFCEALSMTLKSALSVEKVITVGRLERAVALIREGERPDVVLLDLNLPNVNGMEGLIRLKTVTSDVPVIIVSSLSDNRIIASAIRAGAAGFVPKHSQSDVFLRAFSEIWSGKVFVPEGYVPVAEDVADPMSIKDDAIRRLSLLTPQQARILEFICAGKLNKQIAYDLSIAETTVKAHITAILRKLGVQSRTQAVLMAQNAHFAKILQESDSVP